MTRSRREPVLRDARHGRALPSGRALGRVLAAMLRVQRLYVLAELRRGSPSPSLHAFEEPWVEVLAPVLEQYLRWGVEDMARRLAASGAVPSALAKSCVRKARQRAGQGWRTWTWVDWLRLCLRVLSPLIPAFVQQWSYTLIRGVNAATEQQVRQAVQDSIRSGEGAVKGQDRLAPIFGPKRAFTISVTEASRAYHGGQTEAAKRSGVVVSQEWLASADACPKCLALDGKEAPLGEPFYVDPKGGPYAAVYHPPFHPHCMCALTQVVGNPGAVKR